MGNVINRFFMTEKNINVGIEVIKYKKIWGVILWYIPWEKVYIKCKSKYKSQKKKTERNKEDERD